MRLWDDDEMSHVLLVRLTVLRGYTQLALSALTNDTTDRAGIQQHLDRVLAETDQLVALIRDNGARQPDGHRADGSQPSEPGG